MTINIILSVLLALAAVERYLLMRRYERMSAQEAEAARLERSELVARVQGLSWRPEPVKAPSEELLEEEDELHMVGKVVDPFEAETHG